MTENPQKCIMTNTLQPGANEVTIYGLTPTADESSIKVDGKGAATITDMAVDLIPNKEIFDDIYPPESDDSDDTAEVRIFTSHRSICLTLDLSFQR